MTVDLNEVLHANLHLLSEQSVLREVTRGGRSLGLWGWDTRWFFQRLLLGSCCLPRMLLGTTAMAALGTEGYTDCF